MQINIVWDTSVNNAPAAFKADVIAVTQYFSGTFTDPVTINIDVGYGEVGGSALSSSALGESEYYLQQFTYSQLRGALSADAKTHDDTTAAATLPINNPISGSHYWTSTAEAKALGLSASNSGVDGYVGFSSTAPFDYNRSDGVTAKTYDFYAVVAHEFSEIMGRGLLTGETIGGTTKSYAPLDLFHFSSPGHRDLFGTTTGYFSIDGGKTNLDYFNTKTGGDYGDWASSAGADAFDAFSYSGIVNQITETDLKALDVIGWDRAVAGSTYTGVVTTSNAWTSSVSHTFGTSYVSGQWDDSGRHGSASLVLEHDTYTGLDLSGHLLV